MSNKTKPLYYNEKVRESIYKYMEKNKDVLREKRLTRYKNDEEYRNRQRKTKRDWYNRHKDRLKNDTDRKLRNKEAQRRFRLKKKEQQDI